MRKPWLLFVLAWPWCWGKPAGRQGPDGRRIKVTEWPSPDRRP
ncbi:hypothetical protein [Caulobacter sp. B11]|nr:hypothetical protein [Caulobacter sp. B11]